MIARENLGSRLGFILLTAGCAIGLGNIWRFPYITGEYGGALFVVLYLFFLLLLGLPLMLMELSLGRASQLNIVGALKILPESAAKVKLPWHRPGYLMIAGNVLLLMFYFVITAWLVAYAYFALAGDWYVPDFESQRFFGEFIGSPWQMLGCGWALVAGTAVICGLGLRRGVEKSVKLLMSLLLILLGGLAIHSLTMPGAGTGVSFFLKPSLAHIEQNGYLGVLHAAMAHAFFTLSLGIGSIEICGSYIDKRKSLVNESLLIIGLDTAVAITAGLVIFPACFTYEIDPGQGPGLIFVSLPQVFRSMGPVAGRGVGTLFFVTLSIAAITTLVAVAENVVSFMIDIWQWSRPKAAAVFGGAMTVLILPCILGFNYWKGFQPFGAGSCVLDLEDFLISDNILPLGALVIVLFVTNRYGWGGKKFLTEANTGDGVKLTERILPYLTYVLPVLIFVLWLIGLLRKFQIVKF